MCFVDLIIQKIFFVCYIISQICNVELDKHLLLGYLAILISFDIGENALLNIFVADFLCCMFACMCMPLYANFHLHKLPKWHFWVKEKAHFKDFMCALPNSSLEDFNKWCPQSSSSLTYILIFIFKWLFYFISRKDST